MSEDRRYLLRIGYEGHARCIATAAQLKREDYVVCRTSRGIEMGVVLNQIDDSENDVQSAKFLRKASSEDLFLWNELTRLSRDAEQACITALQSANVADVLVAVEPLLDGKTLFFHFLGEPSPAAESQLETLVTAYADHVSQSKFARLLEHGCGPGCGTKEKSRCGTSGSCVVCAVANHCSSSGK